jgi:hypothetical protein
MSVSLCALKRLSLAALASILTFTSFSVAQEANILAPALVGAQPLITQAIDEGNLTVLTGNTHPWALPQFDLGQATATLPMNRMELVLKRGPVQEHELRTLLDNQQDKRSANYHKWLAPEDFGKQFGPTDGDIQIVTAWLQSHGFQVGTTKGRSVLEFSGSASQVQETFHTAIHRYVVNGEEHWANANDPSIPTALTPAVAGILTLHNFLKRPALIMNPKTAAGKIQAGKRPALTFSDGSHGLAPADFATIYNSNPLLTEVPTAINGAGVTIGVVARSNLYSVDSPNEDITEFRSNFLLTGGTFNVVLNGPDPGDLGDGDEDEATLDATWSGAVAQGANIDFVVSASTNTSDGTDLSEIYIVENNLADVMTESFSSCEGVTTSTEAAGISLLAEQAAAQGITYFVSTGDSGAEGCDNPDTETVATQPISVNVLAATPFTVAVGGTLFNDTADPTKYWAATNTDQESAISYIPEDVWNDSCLATSSTCTGANIAAGGGGVSTFFTPKPSWQAGVDGIVNDNARDLPDVSLNSDPHDGYVLCLEGSCAPDSSGNFSIFLVGGTSASAPSFAGIMAMVDQQMGGVRQGQANYILYKLATVEEPTNTPAPTCNASNTTTLPASTCVFNDVTSGNNAVPGELNYGNTTAPLPLYQATSGYDMATGLGSVNIANLVNQWAATTFNATTTTLALSPNPTTITHGQAVTATITVTPSNTTGAPPTPTGDVALIAQTGASASGQTFAGSWTLATNGSVTEPTNYLPGGTYNVSAHYAGNATYGGSDSSTVPVTVTPEGSTTSLQVLTFDSAGNQLNFTGGPFGSFVYLRANVAGASGFGTPTGSVTFSDSFGALNGGNAYTLNSGDALQSGAYAATPNGVIFDAGSHVITASYAGDASFNASASPAAPSFTITPGFFVNTPGNAEVTVLISAPGASGTAPVLVSYSTGFSGAISLACSGLPAGAACSFSPASINATGKFTSTPVSSTLTVSTTAATAAALRLPRQRSERWLVFSGFMLFSMVLAASGRRRLPLYTLALLTLIILVSACGGGGSKTTTPPPPVTTTPTPAGTYTVNITASSGGSVSSVPFTLSVQ